ncbi:MAG TPA: hypothetical protein PK523_01325 [Elusimicrobiales bacterium]|nr:hypothetical protein [Elusimicrobiales bacterium]
MDLKPHDAVKNLLNGGYGIVTRTEEGFVTVLTTRGQRLTLMSRYLAPASPEESEKLKPLLDWHLAQEARKASPAKPPPDPAGIREKFDKFVKHIAARYPRSAESFLTLWSALMEAVGDLPGETWEMRADTAKDPGPVIKVLNPRSGKRVHCLHLYPGWALRMEIKKEHLPPGSEALFPIDNAMFGEGRAAEMIYDKAPAGWQAACADMLRAIYAAAAAKTD